uniref:Uncharacterized protein n=1 Tax=Oryza brachyantha TaxID=4533 RepID=J3NBH5_ORYBR
MILFVFNAYFAWHGMKVFICIYMFGFCVSCFLCHGFASLCSNFNGGIHDGCAGSQQVAPLFARS